jgi:DNA-binding response OmpR family regulator
MEARGEVVPRQHLLADIWGDEHRGEAVLDTTVHRLRRRLQEELSRPDLVATVRGVGYRLRTG